MGQANCTIKLGCHNFSCHCVNLISLCVRVGALVFIKVRSALYSSACFGGDAAGALES